MWPQFRRCTSTRPSPRSDCTQGQRLSREVLLRAELIVSANDASRTLALDVGGTEEGFVAMMNQAAQALGMVNTVAVNSVGLDAEGAHSPPRDMVVIADDPDAGPDLSGDRRPHRCQDERAALQRHEQAADQLRRCDRREDRPHHRRRLLPGGLGHSRRSQCDRGTPRRTQRQGPDRRCNGAARLGVPALGQRGCNSGLSRISEAPARGATKFK